MTGRIDLTRLLVLCGCVGAMACGNAGGEDTTLTRSSWDTKLTVTITENRMQAPVSCPSLSFTMHLDPEAQDGDDLTVTLGAAGQVVTGGRLARKAGAYQLGAPLALPTIGCNAASLTIAQLSFRASDTDADQIADAVSGTGAGTGSYIGIGGDVFSSFSFAFAMAGTTDVTRPRLTSMGEHHPLGYVRLQASEPLVPTNQLTLQGTSSLSLAPGDPAASAIGFLSSDVILPFSGSWTVAGDAEDLIGHPLEAGATLTSLADPGLFADGGFEGTILRATTTGDVRLVASAGMVPALSGSQSLFVGPGSSATLHLARPAGAASVRFTSRVLLKRSIASVFEIVKVGVIGGVQRLLPAVIGVSGDPVATGDSTWTFATPRTEVTVPLTEKGDDVVLLISPRAAPGCQSGDVGLCPPVPALLIDDLRVE